MHMLPAAASLVVGRKLAVTYSQSASDINRIKCNQLTLLETTLMSDVNAFVTLFAQ